LYPLSAAFMSVPPNYYGGAALVYKL